MPERKRATHGRLASLTGANEVEDSRGWNTVNEITARDTNSDSTNEYVPVYNKRGDLIDELGSGSASSGYKYEYDAFGRLRHVKNESDDLVAEYTYDALGRRVGWHYDADADSDVDSSDPWYYFVYDHKWRVVATFRGTDTSPKEFFTYHAAGLDGSGSSSYIDSVICVERDITNGEHGAADGTREKRYYPLQNWRADVVAVLDAAGAKLESVRYAAYGMPTLLPDGDYDQDGDVDTDDGYAFLDAHGNSEDRADMDWDGDLDSDDVELAEILAATGSSSPIGYGTLSQYALRKGYAGYENDGNIVKLAHVRHRVLDSELGRWTRRDPAGYVDGYMLYEYVRAQPLASQDPSGLCVSGLQLSRSIQQSFSTVNHSFTTSSIRKSIFPDLELIPDPRPRVERCIEECSAYGPPSPQCLANCATYPAPVPFMPTPEQRACSQACGGGGRGGTVICLGGQPIACACGGGQTLPWPDINSDLQRCAGIHEVINIGIRNDCTGVPDGQEPRLSDPAAEVCNEAAALSAQLNCIRVAQAGCSGGSRSAIQACQCKAQFTAMIAEAQCRLAYLTLSCRGGGTMPTVEMYEACAQRGLAAGQAAIAGCR